MLNEFFLGKESRKPLVDTTPLPPRGPGILTGGWKPAPYSDTPAPYCNTPVPTGVTSRQKGERGC